ncbi:N-acetylmuramoyl-L-alanine amidase [Oceanirhabdus seepicola]|uniref:N-acetylmuramoyl-L-alanine amidase n=1 Tax=Oceanirhabdus seepicola TaxID=2828781 RepID=A0A9J6P5K5_9CLOT|nr:N-acetylmuramoyl-L-alanine amidase [Oceanirhabdus seepicola]MCM1991999.1 N-acetylmuramoyl-L-alanine amidase [Oceanirhabdus seepicola]
MGTEVCVKNEPDYVAQRVCNKLASLGFKNRGTKTQEELGRRLGELNYTNMPAIIAEVCFVEATEDVAIYLNHGPHVIAKAIAEGVTGQTVDNEIMPN